MNGCSVSTLAGRRIAVGRATIDRLARLFGLDRTPDPFKIRAAAWIDDHIEFTVGAGRDVEVMFVLERPTPEEKGFLATDLLSLRYRGKEVPPPLVRHMAQSGAPRIAGLTIDRLSEYVLSDPELGDPRLAMPTRDNKHPANQLDTWGGEDAWADFFAGGEIARGQLDSIDPTKLFSFVQHCDNECLLVNPTGPVPLVSMVDFPWGMRGRSRIEPPKMAGGADDVDTAYGEMLTTELDEMDVIKGNQSKVRDILDLATSRPNPGEKMLFFSNTCVPTVTGEDVESVVREYQRKSTVPLLYLTVTPKAMNDVFLDLFVTRRKRNESEAPPAEPRTVNLIGFPDTADVGELISLLGNVGVKVNVQLLPDLDVSRLRRLPGAQVNVFRPNQVWAHYYQQLSIDSRIRPLTVTAPYGWEGTQSWIGSVLGALSVPDDSQARRAPTTALEAEWTRVRERAKGHALGIIVRAEEIHYLLDPAHTWGVPLISMLQEAGFALDVIVHMRSMKNADGLVAKLAERFAPGSPHLIIPCRDFDQLRKVLPRTRCEAVLTHHFFDWRLSEAGKNRFSLQHFEMGLSGAIRTVDRLMDICDTGFYRKYRRYLGRTPEGLRAPNPVGEP